MTVLHHHPFYRDLDHHDRANDELVVGDPMNPDWPYKPLRLTSSRLGSDAGPANERRAQTQIHAVAGHRVSLDGRPATAQSSTPRTP